MSEDTLYEVVWGAMADHAPRFGIRDTRAHCTCGWQGPERSLGAGPSKSLPLRDHVAYQVAAAVDEYLSEPTTSAAGAAGSEER